MFSDRVRRKKQKKNDVGNSSNLSLSSSSPLHHHHHHLLLLHRDLLLVLITVIIAIDYSLQFPSSLCVFRPLWHLFITRTERQGRQKKRPTIFPCAVAALPVALAKKRRRKKGTPTVARFYPHSQCVPVCAGVCVPVCVAVCVRARAPSPPASVCECVPVCVAPARPGACICVPVCVWAGVWRPVCGGRCVPLCVRPRCKVTGEILTLDQRLCLPPPARTYKLQVFLIPISHFGSLTLIQSQFHHYDIINFEFH